MSTNRPFVIVISPVHFNYIDLEGIRDIQQIAVARYDNYAPWSAWGANIFNENVAPGDVNLPAVAVPKVPFVVPYADLKSAIIAHVEGKTGKVRFNVNENR